MRGRCALAAASLLVAQGCWTSDEAYVSAVRQLVEKGPEAACCVASWGGPDGAENRRRCHEEAPKRCVFVRDASVRAVRIDRFGDDDGALVDVVVSGPLGTGSCSYQVLSHPPRVEGGTCGAL